MCRLTIREFSLRLRVYQKHQTVFDDIVLRTEPDEVVFEHRFKDIEIASERLVVTTKLPEPLVSIPLAPIPFN